MMTTSADIQRGTILNDNNQILIDKDIIDSLRGLYFGSYKDIYTAVGIRAYRDFNRTLNFGNKHPAELRNRLRSQAIDILQTAFAMLHENTPQSQSEFDDWHKATAERIIKLYTDDGISFSYGQAQKWINMSAKYLFLSGEEDFCDTFQFLHVPIDNYVETIVLTMYGIPKPKLAWSKWSYQQYDSYQKCLRSHIVGEAPLRWEFRNWLIAARNFEE